MLCVGPKREAFIHTRSGLLSSLYSATRDVVCHCAQQNVAVYLAAEATLSTRRFNRCNERKEGWAPPHTHTAVFRQNGQNSMKTERSHHDITILQLIFGSLQLVLRGLKSNELCRL